MSYRITIIYQDEHGYNQHHTITGKEYLMYDDIQVEPIAVRRIIKHGVVIGHMRPDGFVNRSGTIIPPHMIKSIMWNDTKLEDEQREKNNE